MGDEVAAQRLLTIAEVARRLGIGRTKMFALLRDGEIESVRIGRARRIPEEAVDTYIARLRAQT